MRKLRMGFIGLLISCLLLAFSGVAAASWAPILEVYPESDTKIINVNKYLGKKNLYYDSGADYGQIDWYAGYYFPNDEIYIHKVYVTVESTSPGSTFIPLAVYDDNHFLGYAYNSAQSQATTSFTVNSNTTLISVKASLFEGKTRVVSISYD
ncbi:hypothetical protein ACFPPD_21000 [Cohnella suwonensis]|uniref:DUF5626 domain-containing protein n=1 Tax=Cohnella suwonensis TaxID=696072 RepID=A0ABW0LZC3_9BACL